MSVHVVAVEEFEKLAERVSELEARIAAAPDPWPEWMSAGRAAAYLDISVERLRKLQARSGLPFHQEAPGCRVHFKRSDLDTWQEKNRRGGMPRR